MQKESLPTSKKQNPPIKKQPSPNLLDTAIYKPNKFWDPQKYTPTSILPPIKILIILTQVVFITLLGINYFEDIQIEKLRAEISTITKSSNYQQDIESETRNTIKKTYLYQNTINDRVLLHPKLTKILQALPKDSTITALSLAKKTSQMSISISSPLELAQTITRLFEGNLVTAVTIQSARLNTTKDTFSTDLEIWFQ